MEDEFVLTRDHAIAVATNVGRQLGYAVGVHGSRLRDIDLIAAPWTAKAIPPRELAESIAYALPGFIRGRQTRRPHGRVAYIIWPRFLWGLDVWYIDLSIMPRRRR